MSLTYRQRTFVEKLLDVYHDHSDQPVHYSDVASALGVANSTAYEMMRLLERKGYVVSEYHLADHHSGPGRSQVLFRPSLKALKTFRRLLDEDVSGQEWRAVRDRVLERLSAEGLPYDEDSLSDLLATIPDDSDPLAYCAQVLAASLVSLRSQVANRVQQLGILRDIADGKGGLELLGLVPGFALGFASAVRDGSARLSALAGHVRRYQSVLQEMDDAARARLLRFSREIVAALRFPAKAT
jgi:DNA-binding MarR family transcriptional regulator